MVTSLASARPSTPALQASPRGDEHGRPAISAHTLRHTFGTNLTRSGEVDVVVVAQLMGHKRLKTTRRYTLPTEADMEAAVSLLPTDE